MSSPVVSVTDPSKWAQPRRISRRSSKSSLRRSRSVRQARSLSPGRRLSPGSRTSVSKKPIKRTRSLERLKRIGSLPIKPVIKRFITFGCWNRFVDKAQEESKKEFGFQKVLPAIQQHIDTPYYNTDFVLVSGDNYYPKKSNDSNGEKRKVVDAGQLQAGFSLLPKNTEVHLILGNHDIETGPNIFDSKTQGQTTKCKISELEKTSANPGGLLPDAPKIHIFHAFMWTPNIAIIMFDTSLYDNLDEDTVDCYDEFEHLKAEFTLHDKKQERIKEQERFIQDFLKKQIEHRKPIQNVILMGHYPIVSIKMKEGKDKPKKTGEESSVKPAKEKKEKTKDKSKEKAECCLFTHLFTDIHQMFDHPQLKQPHYHYLCADVHMYQKVKVNIPIVPKPEKTSPGEIEDLDTGDESMVSLSKKPIIEPPKQMEITQYVVGTGGAELDDPPELNPIEPKTVTIPETNQMVEFNVEQAQKKNGFLECVSYSGDTELKFQFHSIE